MNGEGSAQWPSTAVVVSQEVDDFTQWLKGYEGSDSLRKSVGWVKDMLYIHVDDSSRVVLTGFTDNDDISSVLSGDNQLRTAGILTDSAMLTFWDVNWVNQKKLEDEYVGYLMIAHQVREYEYWQQVFSESDSIRTANGIFTLWITSHTEPVNEVLLLLGITEFDGVNLMMQAFDVEAAMKKAGVIGDPKVAVLADVE